MRERKRLSRTALRKQVRALIERDVPLLTILEKLGVTDPLERKKLADMLKEEGCDLA